MNQQETGGRPPGETDCMEDIGQVCKALRGALDAFFARFGELERRVSKLEERERERS